MGSLIFQIFREIKYYIWLNLVAYVGIILVNCGFNICNHIIWALLGLLDFKVDFHPFDFFEKR